MAWEDHASPRSSSPPQQLALLSESHLHQPLQEEPSDEDLLMALTEDQEDADDLQTAHEAMIRAHRVYAAAAARSSGSASSAAVALRVERPLRAQPSPATPSEEEWVITDKDLIEQARQEELAAGKVASKTARSKPTSRKPPSSETSSVAAPRAATMNVFQRMWNNVEYFPVIEGPEPPLKFPKGTALETPHQIALARLRRRFGAGMSFMRRCKLVGAETIWETGAKKWQWLVYRKFTANQYSQMSNRLKELKAERSCAANPCSTPA